MEYRSLKTWASRLKKSIHALYLASRDNRVPIIAKVIIGSVVAYALSPIDLIPDFIPLIGYLDDLILLPLGIWAAIRLIPEEVWRECQALAVERMSELPPNRSAAIVIAVIWFLAMVGFTLLLWPYIGGVKIS